MENMEVIPVVDAHNPIEPTAPVEVSHRIQDSGAELEKIRLELEANEKSSVQPALTPEPVAEQPKQPEQPAPLPAPVTAQQPKAAVPVPDKFKTPEGTLDAERLLKSALEAEKELKRLQNQKHQWQQAQPQAPQGQPVAPLAPQSFEAQLEADVKQYGLGPVLANLFEAAKGSAVKEALNPVGQLMEAHETQTRTAELRDIMKNAPEMFTPEGLETLKQIRANNPYINAMAEPWKEAVKLHLGNLAYQQKVGGSGQVQTPNPTIPAAPIAPAGVAPSIPAPVNTTKMTDAQLDVHLSKLTPEQRDQFWKLNGFKPFEDSRQRVAFVRR